MSMQSNKTARVDSQRIRHYRKGDAPEVRKAFLEGLILQDGSFITEGKSFAIKKDATGEASVSECFLFVTDEEPRGKGSL